LWRNLRFAASMCCHRKASGASANIKAPDSFLVAATGIHGIDPHKGLFLWRNLGFSAFHPHKGLFLWRNLRFFATHPHIRLFLWRNCSFSVICLSLKKVDSQNESQNERNQNGV